MHWSLHGHCCLRRHWKWSKFLFVRIQPSSTGQTILISRQSPVFSLLVVLLQHGNVACAGHQKLLPVMAAPEKLLHHRVPTTPFSNKRDCFFFYLTGVLCDIVYMHTTLRLHVHNISHMVLVFPEDCHILTFSESNCPQDCMYILRPSSSSNMRVCSYTCAWNRPLAFIFNSLKLFEKNTWVPQTTEQSRKCL